MHQPVIDILCCSPLILYSEYNHPIGAVLVHLEEIRTFLHLGIRRHLTIQNIIQDIILELLLQLFDRKLSGKLVLKSHNSIFNRNTIHLGKGRRLLRNNQIHLHADTHMNPDHILVLFPLLPPVLIICQHIRIIIFQIVKKYQIRPVFRSRFKTSPVLIVKSNRITDQFLQHLQNGPGEIL